jgi:hypothetical protein
MLETRTLTVFSVMRSASAIRRSAPVGDELEHLTFAAGELRERRVVAAGHAGQCDGGAQARGRALGIA